MQYKQLSWKYRIIFSYYPDLSDQSSNLRIDFGLLYHEALIDSTTCSHLLNPRIFDPCNHRSFIRYSVVRRGLGFIFLTAFSNLCFPSMGGSLSIIYRCSQGDSQGFLTTTKLLFISYFIYEICCLAAPVYWQLFGFYDGLFSQNLVTNLFSVFTNIGSAAQHEFVAHNPHCKIISTIGMIFSANDFRRHIARCTTSILMIILTYLSGNTQIRNPQITLRIEDHIFRLHIAMYDFIFMKILQANDHIGNKKFSLSLIKSTSSTNMIS